MREIKYLFTEKEHINETQRKFKLTLNLTRRVTCMYCMHILSVHVSIKCPALKRETK